MSTDAVIAVEGLSFTYPGAERAAVRDISFAVDRGEIFGFLGPSGAGKSTTQKVLMRLLRQYSGRVAVFGKDLRDWDADYFEQVGISFELPSHYRKLTARENLELFASLYDGPTEAPVALLELVGLADDADTQVGQFSKGMAMRLNFVRALIHRPKLLFLDEPTSGMDPVNGRRIRELILERRKTGTTVFLTTHDMAVADALCDRVAFIVDGELPVIDTPRALKLRGGRRMARLEVREDDRLTTHEIGLDADGRQELAAKIAGASEIETIHTEEASLEQVFIDVTGRSLR